MPSLAAWRTKAYLDSRSQVYKNQVYFKEHGNQYVQQRKSNHEDPCRIDCLLRRGCAELRQATRKLESGTMIDPASRRMSHSRMHDICGATILGEDMNVIWNHRHVVM